MRAHPNSVLVRRFRVVDNSTPNRTSFHVQERIPGQYGYRWEFCRAYLGCYDAVCYARSVGILESHPTLWWESV